MKICKICTTYLMILSIILDAICDSIRTGLEDRKNAKDKADKGESVEAIAEETK